MQGKFLKKQTKTKKKQNKKPASKMLGEKGAWGIPIKCNRDPLCYISIKPFSIFLSIRQVSGSLSSVYACCLCQGFYSCTKHHDQEASWGGKGLFSLHFHTAVHQQRKSGLELTQGRNLEAGADAEAVEGCCLLACSSWLAQPPFL